MARGLGDAVPLPERWPRPLAGAPAARRRRRRHAREKVLRYAFQVAETGFDPAQVSDIYSRIVHRAHLRVAAHLRLPGAAVQAEAAHRRRRCPRSRTTSAPSPSSPPGIFFADDPAFKGKPRELVAAGLRLRASSASTTRKFKSPGLTVARERGHRRPARAATPRRSRAAEFDYDKRGRGLQALDRYTLRVRLREARPRHLYIWAARDILGAVAREVVEAYGDQIMDHPVGTGPFRLAEWRRSSRIVLERNPGYRERVYEAEPNADDAEGQALLQRFKGRRLPMVDRSRSRSSRRAQPRWLSFLNGEQNFLERLPTEFADQAMPRRQARAEPRQAGIQAYRVPRRRRHADRLQHGGPGGRRLHAGEGGAAPRDRSLGNDVDARDPHRAARGQAIPAQTIVPPLTEGYRADVRTESGDYDPARARGAARPLRLRRPRRRRLARAARRQPAGDRVRHPVRPALALARRAVEEEPGRARHADGAEDGAVAGEPEGGPPGQVHGLARRLVAPRRPTATAPWSAPTAARSARATWRASSCKRSTRSTSG